MQSLSMVDNVRKFPWTKDAQQLFCPLPEIFGIDFLLPPVLMATAYAQAITIPKFPLGSARVKTLEKNLPPGSQAEASQQPKNPTSLRTTHRVACSIQPRTSSGRWAAVSLMMTCGVGCHRFRACLILR
ncbi:unnamed protein product [Ectocarpus sp. 12 AP-2014]